jgi:hypothetical protein
MRRTLLDVDCSCAGHTLHAPNVHCPLPCAARQAVRAYSERKHQPENHGAWPCASSRWRPAIVLVDPSGLDRPAGQKEKDHVHQ